MEILSKRYYGCSNGYDRYGNCYSTWDSWARWVVLAVIIVAALVIFFLFSCITARRRRKMGYAPYRGTGWAAPGPGMRNNGPAPPPENYSGTPYYASNYNQPPPPTYQGFYGRGDHVEMQPPSNQYNNVYSPPPGAPPAKV